MMYTKEEVSKMVKNAYGEGWHDREGWSRDRVSEESFLEAFESSDTIGELNKMMRGE